MHPPFDQLFAENAETAKDLSVESFLRRKSMVEDDGIKYLMVIIKIYKYRPVSSIVEEQSRDRKSVV